MLVIALIYMENKPCESKILIEKSFIDCLNLRACVESNVFMYVILDNDFFNAPFYHLTLFTLIKISYTFRFVRNKLAT